MSNIIERLKTNKEAFGLMDAEMRTVAEKLLTNDMVTFVGMHWAERVSGSSFNPAIVYRLRADYICQHPETKLENNRLECLWCGAEIQPEKKAGWVEYDIQSDTSTNYEVRGISALLWTVHNRVGFGGISYLAPCDCPLPDAYSDHLTGFLMTPPEPCEIHGPYAPQKVRFWKEKI